VLSAFRPVTVLKGQLEKTQKGGGLRKALVVAQFIVAVALIAGMVIVKQQLDYLQTKNLGYKKEHLLYVNMSYEQLQKYSSIKTELAQLPGVASIAASGQRLTGYGNSSNTFKWQGKQEDDDRMFVYQPVQKGYLKTIGAELAQGRDFSEEFGADTSNFVLNESAVKAMGLKEPVLGQQIEAWGNPGQIIGVVKDYNFFNLRYQIEPLILVNNSPHTYVLNIRLDGKHTPETLQGIEAVCKKYAPDFPFSYAFADDAYNQLYQSEQVVGKLSTIFAMLAVFISCLGLFGLATFTAERRVKEIGVRKVLGASVVSVVGLLSKEFLALVALSLVVASPLAYFFMEKWLSDFAYRIDIQWTVFALAGILAVVVAFLTVSFQSVKAALANPVKSLRSE
jgi:ABC-type antimicrobial peptide transport system permease subunit